MRSETLGVFGRCLGYALFALASVGCSPSEVGTEQPVGSVQEALTVTIDGEVFTSSIMGTSGMSWCAAIGEGQWDYSDGVISVVDADGRGLGDGRYPHPGCNIPGSTDGTYDSLNFLSRSITENFEIVVRVTSITGMKGAEVGLMMRESVATEGTGRFGAVSIRNDSPTIQCPTAPSGTFNAVAWSNRALVGQSPRPSALVPVGEEGATRSRPPAAGGGDGEPYWLSLQRVGTDFRVARARDEGGKPGKWVPAGGGEYTPTQAYVGVFASASIHFVEGDVLRPTSATFDHLSIRPGDARFRTGALGASIISGDEQNRVPLAAASGYVSTGLNAFYVDPAGMSYKYAETNDPGGLEIQLIDDGGNLVRLPGGGGNYGFLEGGIGGYCPNPNEPDECLLYVAGRIDSTLKVPKPDDLEHEVELPVVSATILRKHRFLDQSTALSFDGDELGKTRGLSASGNTVFVSDWGRDPQVQQKVDDNGQTVYFFTYDNPDYHQVRCVSVATGSQFETLEFPRPGPSAVDSEGNSWVIRSATDYPTNEKNDLGAFAPVHTPEVVCVRPDCTLCGTSITAGLQNPTAVAFDSNNRLYVADNGPAQNIRIYDDMGTSPALAGTFGREGGVFSGPDPGLMNDPSAGGDHRFYALAGIGLDSQDNIYVASTAPRTTIQKFPKTGAPLELEWGPSEWGFYGLGREIGAFDVDAFGNTNYYTLMRKLTLDPDSSSTDFEWKPTSIIRPPYDVSTALPAVAAPSHHFSQGGPMRLRRFGDKRFLFEINANSLRIFRFVGELIKACGHIEIVKIGNAKYRELWFDTTEDGSIGEGDEYHLEPPVGFYPEVAEDGSIWLVDGELSEYGVSLTAQGDLPGEVPVYTLRKEVALSSLLPGENFVGVAPRYRSEGDVLYLLVTLDLETNPALADKCPDNALDCQDNCSEEHPEECCDSGEPECAMTCSSVKECCVDDPGPIKCRTECRACGARSCPYQLGRPFVVKYAGWHGTSTPTETARFPLPTQLDTPTAPDDFMARFADPQCKCADWGYTSFDVVGDKVFAQERHGTIYVYDAETGSEVDRLYPGPEASGRMGWSDIPGSMQAFKRPDSNEYLITTIDSFDRARNLMFRWTPPDLGLGEECWDPHQCESGYCVDGICCQHACGPDTQCISFACVNLEDTPGFCEGVIEAEGTPCDDGEPDTLEDQCREGGECAGTPTAASLLPEAWYVAAEENFTLLNGTVAVWEDKTDNHRDVGNDNIYGGRPTYNPTGWNGTQPTVTFNGGTLLRRYGWAGPGVGTEQGFSVMAVLRSAGPHDGSVAAWWPENGAGYGAVRASVINSGGNSFFHLMRQTDTGSRTYATTADIGTGRHVVVWRFLPQGQTMKITVDGTTYTSALQEPLDAINVGMFLVGASTNNPNWLFQGDISELVVVGGAITDQAVLDFRDYAKINWDELP